MWRQRCRRASAKATFTRRSRCAGRFTAGFGVASSCCAWIPVATVIVFWRRYAQKGDGAKAVEVLVIGIETMLDQVPTGLAALLVSAHGSRLRHAQNQEDCATDLALLLVQHFAGPPVIRCDSANVGAPRCSLVAPPRSTQRAPGMSVSAGVEPLAAFSTWAGAVAAVLVRVSDAYTRPCKGQISFLKSAIKWSYSGDECAIRIL
jgi:hypothetical protein